MFKNAVLVGSNTDPDKYHARDPKIKRGDKGYVMSYSQLTDFIKCPHKWLLSEDIDKTSPAMEWGSLIDMRVFDAKGFSKKYVICPDTYPSKGKKKDDPPIDKPWNRGAKYCEDWEARQIGKVIIKSEKKHDSDIAILSLYEDEVIAEILRESDSQVMVTAEWHCPETGIVVPVQSLLDIVPKRDHPLYGQMTGDLKTSRDAEMGAWIKQLFQRNYHIQGALYSDMYEAATQENRTDFFHIIQENTKPYETASRILSTEFMDMGRMSYRLALQTYSQCLKTGKWGGYDYNSPRQLSGLTFAEPKPWMV